MNKHLLAWVAAGLAGVCGAEVKVELAGSDAFRVLWDGQEVVLPSKPELRLVGPGKRSFFDPSARVFREVEVTASQGVLFSVSNKQGEPVFLGEGALSVQKDGGGIVYSQVFAQAGACWRLEVRPVGENGLDLTLEAQVAPEFRLTAFDLKIADLNLRGATADSGWLGQGRRNLPTTKGTLMGPVPGAVRLNYPSNNLFVPAAVFQDANFAMGICRLGVHDVWRAQFGELTVTPQDKGYELRASTGWAEAVSAASFYETRFAQKVRLRFSGRRSPGPAGYLQLVDAKDLWADYMQELDRHVPIQPAPPYDREKNNIVIMNFFMAENYNITARNPQGWTMNDPGWKSNKWEFAKEAAAATGEELKRLTGFTDDNAGRPVKWIQAYAEKNVREMRETKALANVVWRSATSPGANGLSLDYLPDTHYFHPDMEEQVSVDGPVRSWDWVVADIELLAPDGAVIARKSDVEIHAADTGKLRKMARYMDVRQRLGFKAGDLLDASAAYVKAASDIGAEERYRDQIQLYAKVDDPEARLAGAKPGGRVELKAIPSVSDPVLSAKPLTVRARVKGVRRSAIDIWAKTLTDAGCEIGFLIREDFLMGPPWQMTFMRLDWTSEWQYNLLRQRVEWHQARFGKGCRWFYLDVFANETPDFVLQRLRRDFPDCFFFAEHPNGVALRTIQSWNWFGTYTDLELYLNPHALALVLPERLFTYDKAKDLETVRSVWKHPNYICATHRGARRLVELAKEAGLEK